MKNFAKFVEVKIIYQDVLNVKKSIIALLLVKNKTGKIIN